MTALSGFKLLFFRTELSDVRVLILVLKKM